MYCYIKDLLSLQLQTIFEALDIIAFSGPVKSTYPKTFLELNQVSNNIFIICWKNKGLQYFISTFFHVFWLISFYNLVPVGSAGVWLCSLQDLSAYCLQHTDATVIPPEWCPRSSLRFCRRGECNRGSSSPTLAAVWYEMIHVCGGGAFSIFVQY